MPNTMRALRLTELARDRGLHQPFHDRLMDAYWEEQTDIGDPERLRTLALEVGLEQVDVDDVLAGDAFRDRVLGSTAQAQAIGVTGVPSFLLDRARLVVGAHPREVFEQVVAVLGHSPADS